MKVREIAELVGGSLTGDGLTEITSVADIATAGLGDIVFVERGKALAATAASCALVSSGFASETESSGREIAIIETPDPKLAFARVAALLYPRAVLSGRHDTASIADGSDVRARYLGAGVSVASDCLIGEDAEIHDGVRIGRGVTIGRGTIVYANCVIYDQTQIGDNCVIHAGCVIGADGFGYVRDRATGEYHKFPQIGRVIIENNVELGANTCVDRGALGETRVGEGTKIDNLVQIAHNVSIGKRVVIAAQTGISGSTIIEDDCVIGGQVGMGDHARVMSGAVIGSQAGVLPGKIVRAGVWWGTPVQPLDDYKRQNAHLKGIERLKRQVAELRAALDELRATTKDAR